MKKITLTIILLIFIMFDANASYEKFVPMTIKQPNGEQINCFASGDEFYNWIHDSSGFTIIQNETSGYYFYGIKSNGEVIPSQYLVGSINPSDYGISPWLKLDDERIQQRRNRFNIPSKPIMTKKNSIQTSNLGVLNNISVFIRFSDQSSYPDQYSTYQNQFNATSTASLYSYFKEVSYGKLDILTSFYPTQTGGTCVSYQDSHPRNYYSPYNASTNPIGYQNDNESTVREHTLLANAIASISSQVPANLVIDNDNDGYIDNIAFFVAGTNDAWATLLWPHMWALYTQDVRINGKRVWNYNFLIQSWTSSSRAVSVLCHEMFHTLGSPDLYHYSYDGFSTVGSWDIMESDANPPQHMSAYMKWKYGNWITSIPEITKSGTYTLNPLTSTTGNAFKIKSPNSTNEFFIVEYRRKMGMFESGLPGTGMLVYRIDPRYNGNAGGPPDEVYLMRPNGTKTVNGDIYYANFSLEAGRTVINDNSNPYSFLQDGSKGGLNIFAISSAGSTISFRVNFGPDIPKLISPADKSANIPVLTSFSWSSSPGALSYNLQISEYSDFSVVKDDYPNIATNSFTLSNKLSYFKKYYWRVNAVNSKGTSDWSDIYSYSTTLEPPTLLLPVNNDQAVIANPTFTWQNVIGASKYDIEISLTSDFSNIYYKNNNVSFNFIQLTTSLEYLKTYYWRVRASNSDGNSDWSEVRIFNVTPEAPKVLSQTKTALLCHGESTLLTVISEGRVVQYQWMKDGVEIVGATKALLNVNNSDFPSSGIYTCKLTNLPGSDIVYANPILVYVMTNTKITNKPDTIYIKDNSNAIMEVNAHVEGAPADYPISVQWYSNGVALKDDSRIAGAKSSILSLQNITNSDLNSIFSVKVTGKCGSDSLSGYKIIQPSISVRLNWKDSIENCMSQTDSFYLDLMTYPKNLKVNLQWYKNNVKLLDGNKYSNTTSSNLTIKNLELSDVGNDYNLDIYFPEIDYHYPLNWIEFKVKVGQKPEFIDTLPLTLKIATGKDLKLTSTAKYGIITYNWFKNGIIIPNQFNSILNITNVSTSDAGKYSCIAYNSCGSIVSDTSDVTITVFNISNIDENLIEKEGSINIPNPFDQFTEIYFSSNLDCEYDISIYNLLGELVYSTKYIANVGLNKILINSNNLMNSGLYYYNINSGLVNISGKLSFIK